LKNYIFIAIRGMYKLRISGNANNTDAIIVTMKNCRVLLAYESSEFHFSTFSVSL